MFQSTCLIFDLIGKRLTFVKMYYLDTNILLYSINRADSIKQQQARTLIRPGGFISTQGINELCNVCLRKYRMPVANIDLLVLHLSQALVVLQPEVATIQEALRLHARYGYSYFDCLHLATALQHRLPLFWSEDMHAGHRINSSTGFELEIRNPFISGKS